MSLMPCRPVNNLITNVCAGKGYQGGQQMQQKECTKQLRRCYYFRYVKSYYNCHKCKHDIRTINLLNN